MAYLTDNFDEKVVEILRRGGVGFMPSDTVYGLSCAALDEQAVQKLRKLKERDEHKPFIVLISDYKMLDLLSIDQSRVEPAQKYWPGAFTLVCHAPQAPAWLQLGTGSLAVRMPDNQPLRQLIAEVGPIISTSANKQAKKPSTSANDALNLFGDRLDFYVDAGRIEAKASTVAKHVNRKFKVLREGTVKIDAKEQTG